MAKGTKPTDDRPTLIALEFLVRRLIVRDCLRSGTPATTMADWQSALMDRRELVERLAFGPEAGSDDARVTAILMAGELQRLSDEIAADLREAKS